jgi:hypothetical protein
MRRIVGPLGAPLTLTVALLASPVDAQRRGIPYVEDVVGQGDRVRVTSERASGEFVIADVRSGELSLFAATEVAEANAPIDLLIVSLSGLQVRRGREISFLEGFGGGVAVGGIIGGAFALQGSQPHYRSLTGLSATENILVGVGLGAVVGLFVSRMSDEVWQDVALPHRPLERPATSRTAEGAAVTVVGDVSSYDLVELTVLNRSPDPMQAYVWWEGGARVSLGVVRASSTSTFVTARRTASLALVVSPLASRGPPTGPAPRSTISRPGTTDPADGPSLTSPGQPTDPAGSSSSSGPSTGPAPRSSDFIDVAPGERLEWMILTSTPGVVQDYVRRTLR